MIKYAIYWKPLAVERNGPKFGPQWQVFNVYGVFLTVKGSSSVWVHSVHYRFW